MKFSQPVHFALAKESNEFQSLNRCFFSRCIYMKLNDLSWQYIMMYLPVSYYVLMVALLHTEKHLDSVFTILCKNVEAGTHSMQLATLSCLAEMLPFLPQPSSSEKEVNVKKVCQSMVSPICTCIGRFFNVFDWF